MDSRRLSERARQPGHYQTYRPSEQAFYEVCRSTFPEPIFRVTMKPRTLRIFYREEGETHSFGLEPDCEVVHVPSGRMLFFEVKNHGPAGNAYERAYRHHTSVFEERLRRFFPSLGRLDYHPYVSVFTGALTTAPGYTLKIRHHIDSDHYFLWCDYESEEGRAKLVIFLQRIGEKFLVRGT